MVLAASSGTRSRRSSSHHAPFQMYQRLSSGDRRNRDPCSARNRCAFKWSPATSGTLVDSRSRATSPGVIVLSLGDESRQWSGDLVRWS